MASDDKKTRGEAGFIYSAVDSPESGAVEEGLEPPHHNFFTRLYTGTGAFEVVGRRKFWFSVSGLIVAVASMAGLTGVPERTGYAASKHALVGFFESLRIELRGSGVDVTIVAPDFVRSEIHRRAIGPDGRSLGQSPMQEPHIMTAQHCAQLIVAAMRRRQRMLITSARGRLGRWARLIVPGLVDAAAARAIRERR